MTIPKAGELAGAANLLGDGPGKEAALLQNKFCVLMLESIIFCTPVLIPGEESG